MYGRIYELMLRSAQDYGVLPLTSDCNVTCLFCSNRQNPPGLHVYDIRPVKMDQIDELLSFMQSGKKIIIGESATRINEGEPLTHPDFLEIMRRVRNRFPEAVIQVTTNGSLLTSAVASELAKLKPLEIYLSLNSACRKHRAQLMADPDAERAVRVPTILSDFNIPFHGSLVAQPLLTGWDDIEETVGFLAENHAQTVRIFSPGYTKWHKGERQEIPIAKLTELAHELSERHNIPVLAEPPHLQDLSAVIEGMIKDSPAEKAKIQVGDIITSINGRAVASRHKAHQMCMNSENPWVSIQRGTEQIEIEIKKAADTSSGLVLYHDIDLDRIEQLKRRLTSIDHEALILTSVLAEPLLKAAFADGLGERPHLRIAVVENRFFGGTIATAGLLTVEDMVAAVLELYPNTKKTTTILIPKEPFDHWGYDLMGRSWFEIRKLTGCEVLLL